MVELSEAKGNSSNNTKLQLEVRSFFLVQAGSPVSHIHLPFFEFFFSVFC